jgi:hypothetical protein
MGKRPQGGYRIVSGADGSFGTVNPEPRFFRVPYSAPGMHCFATVLKPDFYFCSEQFPYL